jgi:hypothetical protein
VESTADLGWLPEGVNYGGPSEGPKHSKSKLVSRSGRLWGWNLALPTGKEKTSIHTGSGVAREESKPRNTMIQTMAE